MFKIFLRIKIRLWKLWIKIRYGENYSNYLYKLEEYTKLWENTKKQPKKNNKCRDCKFFYPEYYFSMECKTCNKGSKFKKIRKSFYV